MDLRERFHKVILGAGYSENASQGILAEYFDQYMQDVPEFVKMLEAYETRKQHEEERFAESTGRD